MIEIDKLRGLQGEATFAQVLGMQYSEFRPHVEDALHLLSAGFVERATTALEALVVLNPLSFAAWLGLAQSYEAGGRRDEAAAAFEQALQRDPSSHAAQDGLRRAKSA